MTEVGVFVIAQPPQKRKSQIGTYLRLYLSYVGEDNYAFIESETGNETLFIFSEVENHMDFHKLFTKYGMLVSYQILTKEFLFQKNLHDIFKKGKFKKVLLKFLGYNLTQDDVLDKILELGIGSLNEIDYKVLNQ
jgi:hypothetical protein